MSDIALHHAGAAPRGLAARLAGFRNAFDAYRRTREADRRRREVYLRTMRELQSYRPRELHDLRIDPADFEEVARKQAGW